jgi:DNA replication protein DnaC
MSRPCACGAERAVVGTGAFRLEAPVCLRCMQATSDHDKATAQREASALRLRRARLDDPRRRSWSFASYPTDPEARRAVTTARRWMTSDRLLGANLIVVGAVGAGKTGLAWSILRELVDDGTSGLFVNTRDLLTELRDSYRTGAQPSLFGRSMTIGALVLDDIGAERPTAWAVEQLARLVDARYTRLVPTIVTSNLEPDALLRHLAVDGDLANGQRIVSRLCEGATQLRITADDRRRYTVPSLRQLA